MEDGWRGTSGAGRGGVNLNGSDTVRMCCAHTLPYSPDHCSAKLLGLLHLRTEPLSLVSGIAAADPADQTSDFVLISFDT